MLKEYKEHDDSFADADYRERDSIHSSLRKIHLCIDCDTKTIKWRRIVISTSLCCLLLFSFVNNRVPTVKQLLLYFLTIFIIFYLSWYTYSARTTSKAVKYADKHIDNIKKYLSENRNFILPF